MTLPSWLIPLPLPAQQRALDGWAIDQQGMPGIDLMERAGAGLAEIVAARATGRGPVVVVCGKGNNGGDGYVVARLLSGRGIDLHVIALAPGDQLQGDARINHDRLPGGAPLQAHSLQPLLSKADENWTIVDAILGTGFSGEPHGAAAAAIRTIDACRERARAWVVACDIPSGVDGATGEVLGDAVHADQTVTFHAAKPGLWIAPGKAHAGDVMLVDIGIPAGAPVTEEVRTGLISPSVRDVIPRRGVDATKFAAGAVLVCGGSTGMTGAPTLSSLAAMRAGAGYVTACIPASLNPIFEVKLTEAMTVPLADADGALLPESTNVLLERAERADAVVLGPGLGRAVWSQLFAALVAVKAPIPLVLDADGLNALAAGRDSAEAGSMADTLGFEATVAALRQRIAATVLTPHAGELARLLGCTSAEVATRRLACAREAATRAHAVVVLKGDDTIVVEPGELGRVAISPGGAPALATAGTGDVLSGITGACLAKGMEPFDAACAGVWIHVLAGRIAAERIGTEGVIAGDVVDAIPAALSADVL